MFSVSADIRKPGPPWKIVLEAPAAVLSCYRTLILARLLVVVRVRERGTKPDRLFEGGGGFTGHCDPKWQQPPSASCAQSKCQYDFDSITTNSPYFLLLVLPYPTHLFIGSNTNVSTTDVLLTFCCHASSGQLEVALKCMVNLPEHNEHSSHRISRMRWSAMNL